MKTKLATITVFLFGILLLGACHNSTSYERGEEVGIAAAIAFDSPSDQQKLIRIRNDISRFLASNQELTTTIVQLYADDIARSFDSNPLLIRLAFERIKNEIDLDVDGSRIRGFLEGLNTALEFSTIATLPPPPPLEIE